MGSSKIGRRSFIQYSAIFGNSMTFSPLLTLVNVKKQNSIQHKLHWYQVPLRILQTVFIGGLITRFSNKRLALMVYKPGRVLLTELSKLFESGKIKCVIDSVYSFEKLPDAFHHFGSGLAKGTVVVDI